MESTITNSNPSDILSYYENLYKENHSKIEAIYYTLDLDTLNTFLKNSGALESIIALFGAISGIYNGPRKGWQDIRNYMFQHGVLFNLLDYRNLSSFNSFNRIIDDYNKVKVLNMSQISKDFDSLLQLYTKIVENLGLLLRIHTIKEEFKLK
jgi:hypothetical protein